MNDDTLQKKYVMTDRGAICYFVRVVSSSAPTVILLHGLSSNHTTWRHAMSALAQKNINSIAPDLRGHGFSDKTKNKEWYRMQLQKEDLLAILQQEKIARVHVVGYSYGGYIGIDIASTHPEIVKSLLLISASHVNPYLYTKIPWFASFGYGLLHTVAFLLRWQGLKKYAYFDQDAVYGYWQSVFIGFTTMPPSINFWMLAEILRVDYRQRVHSITCPVRIVYGKGDAFVHDKEIDEMKTQLPNATVVKMEESSHFLASAYQDKITDIIVQFITEQPL